MTSLGYVTYNKKTVSCWAFENDSPEDFKLKSNPSKFGWPEIDRGEFFNLAAALIKIHPAQKEFISRLWSQIPREI